MSLREYQQKRDFHTTREPSGKKTAKKTKPAENEPRFVVQKHAASHLHYDFRLELNGVLKSWAVPKGFPFEHGEKRLAMEVEDHPVEYIDFEGVIPKGQYGGGTVMVWDTGHYSTTSADPLKELESGKLHFHLEGDKLKGEWYLVRMRSGREWLLIRGGDTVRPISRKRDDESVLSGQTMDQLSHSSQVWQSNPPADEKKDHKSARHAKQEPLPHFVEPMRAKLVDQAPHEGQWLYELKFDGFRALALKAGAHVELISRTNKDFTAKFPEVSEAVKELDCKGAVLDGEIVALDAEGRSSFQLLQAYEMGEEKPPLFYYVFDLLELNGADLKKVPLEDRKDKLAKLFQNAPSTLRISGSLGSDPEPLLKKVRKLRLEGIIGKRARSVYESGRRSGTWIKVKILNEQEFVIGGMTPPGGTRKYFGALLVGYYDGKKLVYAGKVGTGFSAKQLKALHDQFAEVEQKACPFADLPDARSGRYGQGITAAEMKKCRWLNPVYVAQIKFAEWTNDNRLRQPAFLGLREDKAAQEVIREKAS